MFKKALYTLALVGAAAAAQAQVDASVNLTGLYARNPQIIGEYAVSDKFGVELSAGTALGKYEISSSSGTSTTTNEWKRRGLLLGLQGKYYFNPDDAADGLYAGGYARLRNVTFGDYLLDGESRDSEDLKIKRLAVGASFGYKAVFAEKFVAEGAVGGGFAPVNDNDLLDGFEDSFSGLSKIAAVDLYARLSIGYRFAY